METSDFTVAFMVDGVTVTTITVQAIDKHDAVKVASERFKVEVRKD